MKHIFVGALLMAVAAVASAQTRPFTLGVSLPSDTNPFNIEVKRGIEAKAKELGWNVVYVSANEVVAAQNDGIGDLIARKVDAIMVSPIDSIAVAPSYDAAARAQIPIISVVRTVKSRNQKVAVTGNFVRIGSDTASWVATALNGRGTVAMISGPAGADLFRDFSNGFESGIKNNPGISVVFKKEGPITREFGLRMAEDILVAYPDISAIYCGNDETALGAAQAVAAAGKQGKIVITGANAVPAALRAVSSGAISMTVDFQPVAWGSRGVATLDRMIKGETLAPIVEIDYAMIDKSNVAQRIPMVN